MDHLMKKSFSMGDISKQQGNAAPVTYKPIDLIEEVDEPGKYIPPYYTFKFYLSAVATVQGTDLHNVKASSKLPWGFLHFILNSY